MKFIIEINEKERDSIRHAGKNIKRAFNKLKNSFEIRIIKDKK